ncbi:alpha-L-rhamnosidase [Micromonospora echinaurantiaca]|uniref:Alpha-L-rhamnosidase n=1 Tax=Micromonospora echinaurantiaca TaxID=47857 RepID=A0A1C5HLC0_9ACTN|nr:alpha-L-rhamnosidase C-terminal domain-containing protein [Micromonospora echinaurantiaca]SCG46814.1 alpha-L-rhamnosidase [Micromonospora echinaurantiaca]
MSRAWAAQWIWCHDSGIDKLGEFSTDTRIAAGAHDRRVLFRRVFDLPEPPVTAPLRITADSRYVLWVNGRELARGPARSHPARLPYDTVDAGPALVGGRNVLCCLVRFYGEPNARWMPAGPTFSHGAGALLAELALPDGPLATDRAWRYRIADAWTPHRPEGVGGSVPEVLDGRRLDPDWLAVDADETGWRPARVITALHIGGTARTTPPTDPYGPLPPGPGPAAPAVPRPAPRARLRLAPPPAGDPGPARYVAAADAQAGPVRGELTFPVELELTADVVAVLTVDWGQVVAGTLDLRLHAPAGTRVDARMCEELDADGRIPAHHHPHGVRYVARGHADRFESADPAGGRYAMLVLTGVGRVRLDPPVVRERLRPRPPGAYFTCSDELLDRIHRTGLRTVDLSAQDAYLDCPTREQRAWVGDSVVHQSVDLLTNPDWGLARWHPRLCASPRPDGLLPMAVACDYEHRGDTYIPDWSLHWIRSVHNLYRWTGDRDLVAELLPVAERVLRWFADFARGGLLHDVTGWVLLDWASVQGSGASAALNGLWGRALRDVAEMSSWLGDQGRARWAAARHAELAAAYPVFWDQRRGAYRDWLRDGVTAPQVSDHATAAAVVGGLVPAALRPAALRFLLRRADRVCRAWSFRTMPLRAAMGPPPPDWDVAREVVEAQPFFRYVVHDAVAELGAAERVAALCRDWTRLFDLGDGTWPETWLGGSHCHGWSATPSRDLPLYTLGVSPDLPGFARARIAPRLGDLAWARGAVPTPHGLIEVAVTDRVEVTSPVPFVLDLAGRRESRPAGSFSAALVGAR